MAIVAGCATIGVSRMSVAPAIAELEASNKSLDSQLQTARTERKKAEDAEKRAVNQSEQLKAELATTKDALESAASRAREQQIRADDLDSRLATSESARNKAQQALNRYENTGVTVEEIVAMDRNLRDLTEERDVIQGENAVLARNLRQLQAELDHLVGDGTTEVPLPEGLSGSVEAVDEKWGFVVLNIGAEDGVLEHGRLLVNRDGKLVAKVEVSSVSEGRSIANVLPDWKQASVQPGDKVLY